MVRTNFKLVLEVKQKAVNYEPLKKWLAKQNFLLGSYNIQGGCSLLDILSGYIEIKQGFRGKGHIRRRFSPEDRIFLRA